MSQTFKLKKGLDLPVEGKPRQVIEGGNKVETVAILGHDYVGMKPTMLVKEGERVKLGQALLEDKKKPGVMVTSPGCGTVKAIHRGARRVLRSVVIELDGDEAEEFQRYDPAEFSGIDHDTVCEQLRHSGLWNAFRTRPYSKAPETGSVPSAIFVTSIDTRPLAADPMVVINDAREEFNQGLALLTVLTHGNVYVNTAEPYELPKNLERLVNSTFQGPHPAGLPGTHMHMLEPAHAGKTVWHINHQDVIAFARLFKTGRLPVDRIVAIGGPMVKDPRLLRTRMGANAEDLLKDELEAGECRIISGSVLAGKKAAGWGQFLGRFHNQISILPEGCERELLGWIKPGRDKFSAINSHLSSLLPKNRLLRFTTSTNGSPRAMVPIGNYERIMPLDILPTQLLRALLTRDTDLAQQLGCLELDEEDLALCSYVSSSKFDYGLALRACLEQIEREG
ncbi:Na(+)-translocating NADH-quinone reductase subunit A [Solemya elarraichensis gill symbiont]|uniref:Na(+)-translocating NADH-quinone reductase subunit A n=1 Tax=Solemya elarraichensis gill symbiont TaxID=1918949 RepID=A0A1T2L9J1_9GAMM|nr:Na(+)-translocating NADH-quinone reductase subunit A [Solemya elarraichensis gill symbiont]OOZ41767.1 NADH:ubiquinone reductase (Na(+)-transporting) subunit A [Solemya elarraichensis gill symbiont]